MTDMTEAIAHSTRQDYRELMDAAARYFGGDASITPLDDHTVTVQQGSEMLGKFRYDGGRFTPVTEP